MKLRTLTGLIGAGVLALGGVVSAQTQAPPPQQQQQQPQPQQQPPAPTQPASDPIGAILRQERPAQPPVEEAPPAPGSVPAVVVAPAPPPAATLTPEARATVEAEAATETEADEAEADVAEEAEVAEAPPVAQGRRERLPVAVIQALDKITAETMRFEVRVGGPPVRYKGLVFTARACEVSAPDELTNDSIAYLEIRSQPRGMSQQTPSRQVFRGWMYASAPSVSGLEHPIYDAWVVECRA